MSRFVSALRRLLPLGESTATSTGAATRRAQVGQHGSCTFYVEPRVGGDGAAGLDQGTWHSLRRKEVRTVQMGVAPEEYDPDLVAPEWAAWLNYQRTEPPTEDEIQRNRIQLQKTLENAARLEAEEEQKRLEAGSLHSQVEGHAAQKAGKARTQPKASDTTTSQDGEFQPAPWTPGSS